MRPEWQLNLGSPPERAPALAHGQTSCGNNVRPRPRPVHPRSRRGRQCGVDVFPHRFRHHFSHTWLDRGGAEGDLMELNGWTSPQMLRRYGASARSARARRRYDRVMEGAP
jgi:integrase